MTNRPPSDVGGGPHTHGELGFRGWRDLELLAKLASDLVAVPSSSLSSPQPLRRAFPPVKADFPGHVILKVEDGVPHAPPDIAPDRLLVAGLEEGRLSAYVAPSGGSIFRIPSYYWATTHAKDCYATGLFSVPRDIGRLPADLSGYPVLLDERELRLLPSILRSEAAGQLEQAVADWLMAQLKSKDPQYYARSDLLAVAKDEFEITARGFDRVWASVAKGTAWASPGRRKAKERKSLHPKK